RGGLCHGPNDSRQWWNAHNLIRLLAPRRAEKARFRRPIETYSQGLGSMITEPPTDGAKNALRDFETLYIGGAEHAVVRRALVGYDGAKSRLCAIARKV